MAKKEIEKVIRGFKLIVWGAGVVFAFSASVFAAGQVYTDATLKIRSIEKKADENSEKCEEVRKESNQHLSDINKRLERIEETIGKVVEYVWQGEGDKCKLLSQRKSQTLDKKKSAKRKKRKDMQQHKRLIASD